MIPTHHLRHAWRTINDGNGDIKVLALQQWFVFGTDPDDEHGEWHDVTVSVLEPASL